VEIPFALLPQHGVHADTVLVVHDGSDYATRTCLLDLIGDTTAVALLDPPGDRMDSYSCDPGYADELPWLVGDLRDTHQQAKIVGVGASLGALALLHAHTRRPLFDALLMQSGSFFRSVGENYENWFSHFRRIAAFVDELHVGVTGRPVPAMITCGFDEENLRCNQALAETLRRSGWQTAFEAHPGGHDWPSWDDALNRQLVPLLHELDRPLIGSVIRPGAPTPTLDGGLELGG
jgi:enterochelin esterase family protein